MSQLYGQKTVTASGDKPWEKPAAADDIVDPIDIATDDAMPQAQGREQSEEEEEDVPLDVKLTDALSMLAKGGHDYGSRPVVDEEFPDEDILPASDDRFDSVVIDESSKDA